MTIEEAIRMLYLSGKDSGHIKLDQTLVKVDCLQDTLSLVSELGDVRFSPGIEEMLDNNWTIVDLTHRSLMPKYFDADLAAQA